jgi:hypothetical protein
MANLLERSAAGFQLLAFADQYSLELAGLLACTQDPERYAALSQCFERMRCVAATLPELSVSWVGVLISHAELVHALFRPGGARDSAGLREAAQAHTEALEHLRAACQRLLRPAVRVR